jgi:arylsulfatase A-like enzyme
VNTLLRQFSPAIDSFTSWNRLYLENMVSLVDLFQNDIDTAIIARNRALKLGDDGFSYTLFLSRLYEMAIQKKIDGMQERFPRGVTNNDGFDYYLLEEGIDWLSEAIKTAPQPFLGYYHFYPPHDPYNTRSDFYDAFLSDGYHPTPKEVHFLQRNQPIKNLREFRRWYDEFILYVDAEFDRLYTDLERSGILENTWLVLTSDHGELFERSILGHTEPVFYQPVFKIPLLIFPPGRESRVDIFTNTSAIDLLPTLCLLLGQEAPSWSEGMVMPPFAPTDSLEDRELTSIQVSTLLSDHTIDQATAVIVRGQDKLVWYPGYQGLPGAGEGIELFDLSNDPEELNNRYPQETALAGELLNSLRHRLVKLQQSYP